MPRHDPRRWFGVFIQFVAERFSAEDYTTAFGMNNLLVMGLACIPGPFIGGWLVDVFSTRGNCESDNQGFFRYHKTKMLPDTITHF